MKTLIPYLTFAGNCREAVEYYKEVLNGEIDSIQTFGEAKSNFGAQYDNYIMHADFKAENVHFMASDGMPGFAANPGNNISLDIDLTDLAEQAKIFEALAKGGKVDMPLQDTFWGAKYGMLTDRYGIHWMLNCYKQPVPAV